MVNRLCICARFHHVFAVQCDCMSSLHVKRFCPGWAAPLAGSKWGALEEAGLHLCLPLWVCMFVWSCGFIRGLLSADAVTCCEAGVSEACHTSQHCHCFKDTLGVLGHLLLSDNISPQQNKGWLFVFTEIMFWMWVWGEMQSFIRWKCLHAWKSPAVTPLYCNHPFSCSGWWNALIGRCWEPAKCCLFTQLHQSKQTNTGQPKNMEI